MLDDGMIPPDMPHPQSADLDESGENHTRTAYEDKGAYRRSERMKNKKQTNSLRTPEHTEYGRVLMTGRKWTFRTVEQTGNDKFSRSVARVWVLR